jgi:hypothetical protein
MPPLRSRADSIACRSMSARTPGRSFGNQGGRQGGRWFRNNLTRLLIVPLFSQDDYPSRPPLFPLRRSIRSLMPTPLWSGSGQRCCAPSRRRGSPSVQCRPKHQGGPSVGARWRYRACSTERQGDPPNRFTARARCLNPPGGPSGTWRATGRRRTAGRASPLTAHRLEAMVSRPDPVPSYVGTQLRCSRRSRTQRGALVRPTPTSGLILRSAVTAAPFDAGRPNVCA